MHRELLFSFGEEPGLSLLRLYRPQPGFMAQQCGGMNSYGQSQPPELLLGSAGVQSSYIMLAGFFSLGQVPVAFPGLIFLKQDFTM